MGELAQQHQADLAHHVRQARTWLDQANQGTHTVALSYAALELRYAIERLAVHYWRILLNRALTNEELDRVGQFKFVEHQIYDLAGHQREIDGHFEFGRIYLGALQIDVPMQTPQINALSRHWHDCSEVCHIGWTLASSAQELQATTFAGLVEIADLLARHAASLSWLMFHEPALLALRDRFIAGQADANDVVEHMRSGGVWARVEYPDGRPPQFIGVPIPPEGNRQA